MISDIVIERLHQSKALKCVVIRYRSLPFARRSHWWWFAELLSSVNLLVYIVAYLNRVEDWRCGSVAVQHLIVGIAVSYFAILHNGVLQCPIHCVLVIGEQVSHSLWLFMSCFISYNYVLCRNDNSQRTPTISLSVKLWIAGSFATSSVGSKSTALSGFQFGSTTSISSFVAIDNLFIAVSVAVR
mgnify:CR=1 FL=1